MNKQNVLDKLDKLIDLLEKCQSFSIGVASQSVVPIGYSAKVKPELYYVVKDKDGKIGWIKGSEYDSSIQRVMWKYGALANQDLAQRFANEAENDQEKGRSYNRHEYDYYPLGSRNKRKNFSQGDEGMKQENLQEILKLHKLWLNKKEGGKYADLRNVDLRNVNLREADLSGASLSYADLSNANLGEADLSYADLSNANLSYADLDSANLSYADLSNADLRKVNLSKANLREADLSNANLDSANLRNADLKGADLSKANLREADLRDANLKGINLKYVNLKNAKLD